MLAVWRPLLLLVAAADAGTAEHASATREVPTQRQTLQTSSAYGAAEFRDVVSGASTTGAVRPPRPPPQEEPATQVEIREPNPSFDAGVRADARTAARPDAPAPATAPASTADTTSQSLLEQSKAQTEAMQALLAQQQAQEQARLAEQQARTDRAAAVQDVRDTLGGTMQTLATSGDYDASSLTQASASLRRTAAAATSSGAVGEATRASEAASMVDAANAALTQRNAQQAQWYLTRAALLLGEQQGRGGY
jgi:hypothetical protein